MSNIFSTEALLKSLKSNPLILHSNITMGYVPGLPMLSVLNGNLCLKIPYLKYKITGEIDKTLVYPIKFVVTISVPEGVIVGIEDLAYNNVFANIEFNNPVGLFRHDSIKQFDKIAYFNLRNTLYAEYDKIVNHLSNQGNYTIEDEKQFKSLLNLLVEPSLYPFYRVIDPDFSNKYFTSNN